MKDSNPYPEHNRQAAPGDALNGWRRWGPYLSERQWGTVREDYSADGEAWDYFPFEHAASRAYRWGEDGIGGFCDDKQTLCIAPAFWNERDPLLKERFYGLNNTQGNHGEDVKELYYYLDGLPSHGYQKMLYKYPQARFPYERLLAESRARDRSQPEFELCDTGIFDAGRYFDIFIEYAKAGPDEILLRVTAHNRGPDPAPLHILLQLWFRNIWSWGAAGDRPSLHATGGAVSVEHPDLGGYCAQFDDDPELLFCDNDTNQERLYGNPQTGYFKDGFQAALLNGRATAVNPAKQGTKACGHYRFVIEAGGSRQVRMRLSRVPQPRAFADFAGIFARRIAEADAFYAKLGAADAETSRLQRQAFAGMLWSKQFYYYDIPQWLNGDPGQPAPPGARRRGRNRNWPHLNNADIISMPDKWEYPWYACWDLAFHCVTLALIDPAFAKRQMLLMTRVWYMHPNGQMPAYEWAFDDANPPVHAWAAWEIYQTEREATGVGDLDFLERVTHKLIVNFTWWVNRKDADGNNVFQGGFLGLDNIGVFDRSKPLPTGGYINQADATSWMAMYCLNLMRIALELALHNRVYEDIATKFFEHFLYIAQAMTHIGDDGVGLWDEEDGFFYDVLRFPNGERQPLKVRSMVGLIPIFAVEIIEPDMLERLPDFKRRLEWFLNYRPDLAKLVSRWNEPGRGNRHLLSLLGGHRMKRLLTRALDEAEFLSDYGIRSLSRIHREHPYVFDCCGDRMTVEYQPGESAIPDFGGNSNWRGPVWFPVNYLLIVSLRRFHRYYGDDFKIEYPAGSGRFGSLAEVADALADRLLGLFLPDADGRRALFGDNPLLQNDPHFKDYWLFHEYFHGDSGCGLGASHQTGWTGLVANLLDRRKGRQEGGDADRRK